MPRSVNFTPRCRAPALSWSSSGKQYGGKEPSPWLSRPILRVAVISGKKTEDYAVCCELERFVGGRRSKDSMGHVTAVANADPSSSRGYRFDPSRVEGLLMASRQAPPCTHELRPGTAVCLRCQHAERTVKRARQRRLIARGAAATLGLGVFAAGGIAVAH